MLNAGWHISYFLSRQQIHNKIFHAGDTYKNTKRNHDDSRLECLIKKCQHLNDKESGHRISSNTILQNYCDKKNDILDIKFPKWMMHQACFNNNSYTKYFPNIDKFQDWEVDSYC